MGAEICAKETAWDSDGSSTAKGDINALGHFDHLDHCASGTGQKRSCAMSTAAAQQEWAKC